MMSALRVRVAISRAVETIVIYGKASIWRGSAFIAFDARVVISISELLPHAGVFLQKKMLWKKRRRQEPLSAKRLEQAEPGHVPIVASLADAAIARAWKLS